MPINELAEAAALALQAHSILLLLDNVDAASAKTIDSLHKLLNVATVAAISMTPAATTDHNRDLLASICRRATLVTLQPLDQGCAALVHQVAPEIDPVNATAILRRVHGNPQALVAYAEYIASHGDAECHQHTSVMLSCCWLIGIVMLRCLFYIPPSGNTGSWSRPRAGRRAGEAQRRGAMAGGVQRS